jgi:hypothetical protein
MSRFLLFAALAACTAAESAPNTSPIDAWLDRWVEARRCLVADADDTQTGVTIAFLLGRICDSELTELATTSNEPLAPKLIEAIRMQPSVPEKRAAAIAAVDKLARDLGRRIERDVSPPRARPLPVLKPQRRLAFDGMFRFGGGLIRNFGTDEVVIDGDGTLHEYPIDGGPRELATSGGKHRANADAGPQRVVVWTSKEWAHAYEIDVSSDAGATWTKLEGPAGTSYLGHWQDPRTRAIELLVRTEAGQTSIHRITPQAPTPVVRKIESGGDLGTYASCAHGGQAWSLASTTAARFGDKPMRLTTYAHLGDLDCHGSTALVVSHWPDAIERCRDRCEKVFSSPNNHEGRGALLDDGRWIYAVAFEQVVGVWTESTREPTFYRFSKPAELKGLVVLGGAPALVFDDHKAIELVTL